MTTSTPSTSSAFFSCAVESELFFVENPDVTVRDVAKMKRLSNAVNEMLDAAN